MFIYVYLLCVSMISYVFVFFFFKQKTAYEMRISDWSSDVCSSDLLDPNMMENRFMAPKPVKPLDEMKSEGYIENWICYKSDAFSAKEQIGRASCRERVCKYV